MKHAYLSAFETRQVMKGNEYEVFHRVDAYSAEVPPHRHDFYELYCLLSDGVTMAVEGRRYALEPGEMLLIGPGETHIPEFKDPRRPVERVILWINADFADRLLEDLPEARRALREDTRGRNRVAVDRETGALMQELLFGLLREKRRGEPGGAEPGGAELCRLMVTQLLIHLSRHLSATGHTVPARVEQRSTEVLRVYEYIGAHLTEDLSVSRLAELFFMDKNTLTRQFKRLTGMTPGECVRRCRLEAAHAMIAAGAGAQSACAECGFTDYSAFYRAFRQMYGTKPSAVVEEPKGVGSRQ